MSVLFGFLIREVLKQVGKNVLKAAVVTVLTVVTGKAVIDTGKKIGERQEIGEGEGQKLDGEGISDKVKKVVERVFEPKPPEPWRPDKCYICGMPRHACTCRLVNLP